MKKLLVILTLFSRLVLGQTNLVPNPSFEYSVNCPTQDDEAAACQFWTSYRTSPDYFNSCNTFSTSFSTPYNLAGYQIPATGNSYMGLILYASPTTLFANYREYLGAKLTNTLITNQKYFFSIKCVATKSNWAPSNCYSSKIGVNFSKTSFTLVNPYPIINSAKVFANTIINDTTNWQTIKGSFIADSAYQYIILGNFFNDSQTDTLIYDSGTNCTAYYLIDNVCLSTDSVFAYNYIPQQVQHHHIVQTKIYPNPASKIISIESDKNFEIILFNKFGQKLFTKKCYGLEKIDIEHFSVGLYYLQIIQENKSYYEKIIIQH
ncbi:MAG: T9SS type A sorting domain-containing protein [Sphingobacteriaceae bacterium]